MKKTVFLSHSHVDRDIAKCFSLMIERVTLSQLQMWVSTDERGERGIVVGDNWLEKVRSKLQECQAIIPLITPNSINRPWIYFESGFGAGIGNVDIIPVCIYIDTKGKIPSALTSYQTFHLSNIDQTYNFLRKLLAKFDIVLDEGMANIVVEPAFKEIIKLAEDQFAFNLNIKIDDKIINNELILRPGVTIQDVLDQIYYRLPSTIPAHSYLDTWILYNPDIKRHLIIRGFAARASAKSIFQHDSIWEVKFLERPCDLSEVQDPFKEEYGDYRKDERMY